jgi:hypothetical protein
MRKYSTYNLDYKFGDESYRFIGKHFLVLLPSRKIMIAAHNISTPDFKLKFSTPDPYTLIWIVQ